MNYKIEREHDKLLIRLVEKELVPDHLSVLKKAFRIDADIGHFKYAVHRRPFDVEIKFSNCSIIVETKVDSEEDREGEGQWQTERIASEQSGGNKEFRFITYGTSEYYTKPYDPGPASKEFKHIGLDAMISFVEEALAAISPRQCQKDYKDWLCEMQAEKRKRDQAPRLLKSFGEFKRAYLGIHGDNDFPRNRILFCAPELAFPVFGKLAREWNASEHINQFGKVCLYPIGRRSPSIHDSILNFWEMWKYRKHLAPDLSLEKTPYFEINEDFNLHLKVDDETLNESHRKTIWTRLEGADWPNFAAPKIRDYKQTAFVLYEIDFGFLDVVDDTAQVIQRLAEVLKVATATLGRK